MMYTELAPRRQQFYVAPELQQPNSVVVRYTTSLAITKRAINVLIFFIQSRIQNHRRHERSESAREQSIFLITSDRQ